MTPRPRLIALSVIGSAMGATAIGRTGSPVFALVGIAAVGILSASRWRLLCLVVAPSLLLGWMSVAAEHSFEPGWSPPAPVFDVRLTSDPIEGGHGFLAFGTVTGQPVALRFEADPGLAVGESASIRGVANGRVGTIRGRTTVSVIRVVEIVERRSAANVFLRSANALRTRLLEGLRPESGDARALLAGFLIGDVSEVDDIVLDEMRRSGLSHLVAVSGSNVALFLALWWVVTAPLSMSARARGAVGIAGLVVFGHLTRWEPSVVRASAMAGVVLVGRTVGVVVEGWTALAAAVVGTLWFVPDLVDSIGFQLSVAATAGILAAPDVGGSGTLRAGVLTLAAQVAVAPILLVGFGSVPLFSPIANLVAIPVVGFSTVVGGIGALTGFDGMVELAAWGAQVVIGVGRLVAPWPQVGWLGLAAVLAAAFVVMWKPSLVPFGGLAMSMVLVSSLVGPVAVRRPAVVFLDVGQGDAALILTDEVTVLVDGGPDPVVLEQKLHTYGARHIDLIVATHVHADHLEGLIGVLDRRHVGRVWTAFGAHRTPASTRFDRAVDRLGIPRLHVEVGQRLVVGELSLTAHGPLRKYASPNDESIVFLADLGGVRYLFPGDIETFAQAEIAVPDVDVLKVPHQGAATSDAGWLERHAGAISVISVGPNQFGHPAPWVEERLASGGSVVVRTDRTGDVVIYPERPLAVATSRRPAVRPRSARQFGPARRASSSSR